MTETLRQRFLDGLETPRCKAALALVLAAAFLVPLLANVAPARADFGIKDLDAAFTDAEGSPQMQAGSHPFAYTVKLAVNTKGEPAVPDGELKDLVVTQAAGIAGTPTPVPRCSNADFLAQDGCSDASAVGVAEVLISDKIEIVPIYALLPSPGVAAKLGFKPLNLPVTIAVSVNPDPPFNLIAKVENVYSQVAPFFSSRVTLWGVPADPAHDSQRGLCAGTTSGKKCPVALPEIPFLTLPTRCDGPLPTRFEADSWQKPDVFVGETIFTHDDSEPPQPLGLYGCGSLDFSPQISAQPTNHSAAGPTGLDVEVNVADEGLTNPDGVAQSQIKRVQLTLPQGMTVNPSQAEGLGTCSPADLARETAEGPPGQGCPQSAKIGTLEVETPLLEGTVLHGALYVATPYQNPFNSLIALYMVVKDPTLGILLRLPVKVAPDPQSGQLISTVDEIPQFPFSSFHLHFREGGRSPLITPSACGTYETKALFTPYSGGPALPSTASFAVTSGVNGAPCPPAGPPPFHPGFSAGSQNNAAGHYSPFYMRITRADGEGDITRFDSILPKGVTGKIAGLAQCPDAAIAAAKAKTGLAELASPSCPAGSEIGHVLAGAGVGSELTYVGGKIYLAGPYGGDPLSIVVITPAVAGPFDVGTVVVREALNLNPETGEVEVDGAASDPIPHILAGIPLSLRDLRVYVDRPNFTLNPTSCAPTESKATIFGSFLDLLSPADDVPYATTSRFQAASCASLAFRPKLSLVLKGGTKRNAHPSLRATLTPRAGDANVGKAAVTLPHSEFIDPLRVGNPCTRAQFAANACPPASVLGSARATTPLLDAPLEGPVYFRSNGGVRKVPDIVADLHGQFRVILVGYVDSVNARVRTTFATPPDAPVSSFQITLKGGKEGVLVNSANLCAHKRTAAVAMTGQNGRLHNFAAPLKTDCKKQGKAKRKR